MRSRNVGSILVVSLLLLLTSHHEVDGFSTSVGVGRIHHGPQEQVSTRQYFSQRNRRTQLDPYDNYYENEGEEDAFPATMDDDSYWDDENDEDATPKKSNQNERGGLYKVQFDAATEIDPKETQLDWEVCSDGETEALVLLPPEAVERPSAVLHFVGGTFFGSLPKIYYRSFLEGLVRNTQCAVVVTPIPVTLLRSPLQHISLGRKLQSSFETAWKSVLEDEYGDLSDVVRVLLQDNLFI
jgi:Protein of unknown function (DUF1350)